MDNSSLADRRFHICTNGGKEEKETWSVKMARSEIQRFPEPG